MLNAAFIFIAPGANPATDRGVVETPSVCLHSIGVSAIELCGGFGIRGTYMVEQAVWGKARVGAVRFDLHPGLDNKSGDDLF